MPDINSNQSCQQIRAISDRVQEHKEANDWDGDLGGLYAEVSDHHESARWFREGIDVALRTGDPDQVVIQLLEGLERAWESLDQSPEPGLVDRVQAFVDAWQRPSHHARPRWEDPPPLEQRRCEHCGHDPAVSPKSAGRRIDRHVARSEPAPNRPPVSIASSALVSLAWFPRGEWEKATAAWPDLLEDLPADHGAYSHRIEARLKRLARNFAGHPIPVSPITVDGLTDFCTPDGDAPGTAEARSSYAAEISRRGSALLWPPGRNAPCWCGSGRKYKACCGPIQMAAE